MLRIKMLQSLQSLKKRCMRAVTRFTLSAERERFFRKEFEQLLPKDFQIVRFSHYTEDDREFSGDDRTIEPPTDYEIVYKNVVIAAIEVTTGVEGRSYAGSKYLPIDEKKLKSMDGFVQGWVVERILVGEPHFVWADRKVIRDFPVVNGSRNHNVSIEAWNVGLIGLANAVIKLGKREDENDIVRAA
jgi:hypothetical protein